MRHDDYPGFLRYLREDFLEGPPGSNASITGPWDFQPTQDLSGRFSFKGARENRENMNAFDGRDFDTGKNCKRTTGSECCS